MQEVTRYLTPKSQCFGILGEEQLIKGHLIQDEWALWTPIHTQPEVLETGE